MTAGKTITGTSGMDAMTGTAGDDRFIPGEASDFINGGAGTDTVVYPLPPAHYRVRKWADGQFTIFGPGGWTDSTSGVERFEFAGVIYEWDNALGGLKAVGGSSAPSIKEVLPEVLSINGVQYRRAG